MPVNRKRKSRKKTLYHVKKGTRSFAEYFVTTFSIFALIFMVAGFFILFQWKNVKISKTLREIDQLKTEILELNAQQSALETIRNQLLRAVPERAQKKLGMIVPVEQSRSFTVNEKELVAYEKKDQKVSQQFAQSQSR